MVFPIADVPPQELGPFPRLGYTGSLLDRAAEVHAQTIHETLTSRFSAEEQAVLLKTLSQIDG